MDGEAKLPVQAGTVPLCPVLSRGLSRVSRSETGTVCLCLPGPAGPLPVGRAHDEVALAQSQGQFDGLGEPRPDFGPGGQAIDDHFDVVPHLAIQPQVVGQADRLGWLMQTVQTRRWRPPFSQPNLFQTAFSPRHRYQLHGILACASICAAHSDTDLFYRTMRVELR